VTKLRLPLQCCLVAKKITASAFVVHRANVRPMTDTPKNEKPVRSFLLSTCSKLVMKGHGIGWNNLRRTVRRRYQSSTTASDRSSSKSPASVPQNRTSVDPFFEPCCGGFRFDGSGTLATCRRRSCGTEAHPQAARTPDVIRGVTSVPRAS
jgi:hypothetical protein